MQVSMVMNDTLAEPMMAKVELLKQKNKKQKRKRKKDHVRK